MTAATNGSATNTTVVAALSHQAQYCGPYKIEKTLGKGQTDITVLTTENWFSLSGKDGAVGIKQ
uniref:Uncharacterized protein n=1 Tax=Setaria digitata TaxID=48799 RepID=A0A915PT08_9BILA